MLRNTHADPAGGSKYGGDGREDGQDVTMMEANDDDGDEDGDDGRVGGRMAGMVKMMKVVVMVM